MTSKPHKGTIKNWYIDNRFSRPVVSGNVFGHPDFSDNYFIHTSYIVDMGDDKTWVETRNSVYTLDNGQKENNDSTQ